MGATSLKTRLMAVLFGIGIFAALPIPVSAMSNFWKVIIPLLWFMVGVFAWSIWFSVELTWPLWMVSTVLSLIVWLKGGPVIPLLLLAAWGPWYRIRTEREKKSRGSTLKLVALLAFVGAPAFAKGKSGKDSVTPGSVMIPKYLRGYELNDLSTCLKIEEIPWRFRPDNRKTRLILRDTLRLGSETKFSTWEAHQVMDNEGYVTYIFRRVLASGQYESLVIKDNIYNRILETAKGPKITERQNLRNLINRPVFTFFHADGSTLAYLPGLAGRSLVTVQLSQAEGRLLPPLFLKGSICDRPEDEKDTGNQATGGTSAFPAVVQPGRGG